MNNSIISDCFVRLSNIDLINQQNNFRDDNNIINTNNTNVNQVTVALSSSSSSSPPPQKQQKITLSIVHKCLLLISLLLLIALVTMIGLYIHRTHHVNRLKNDLIKKDKTILEEQIKNNQSIQTIEQLRNQLNNLEKEKGRINRIVYCNEILKSFARLF
jgi:hypothetical protein